MPTFSEKIRRLMRSRGETTRSLGGVVGASSGAVTGWTNGALPRPDVARRLADYFGVPVEALLDDARELPAEYPSSGVQEEAAAHLVSVPLKTAAAEASKLALPQEDRQRAFEAYLGEIHRLRAEAEQIAGENTPAAVDVFNRLLATWLATHHGSTTAAAEDRRGVDPKLLADARAALSRFKELAAAKIAAEDAAAAEHVKHA